MAQRDFEFELIFDELVDSFLEDGKDFEWIEETLKNEVDRAIDEAKDDLGID